jgi:hypothetical protein
LKDFIDGINEIAPVQQKTQDQTIQDDIASIIDISKLRLVEAACEGSYRSWSEKASQVIQESEAGTIDRCTYEEYIRDQDEVSNFDFQAKKKTIEEAFPGSSLSAMPQEGKAPF